MKRLKEFDVSFSIALDVGEKGMPGFGNPEERAVEMRVAPRYIGLFVKY